MKAAANTEAMAGARTVRARGRAPDWAVPTVRAGLVLTDILIAMGCFIGAFLIREGGPLLSGSGPGLNWSALFLPYASLLVFLIPIRVLVLSYYNLYRLRGEFSFVDEGIRIFKAVSIGSLLIVAAAFLYRGGFTFRAFSYARGVFVLDYALTLAAYTLSRLTVRGVQTAFRERGVNLIPTLVVGRGREAELFIKEVKERPILG